MKIIRVLALAAGILLAAEGASSAAARPDKSTAMYKTAAEHYRGLKPAQKKSTRAPLEKSLAKFKEIYTKYPGGAKTPESIYMSGYIYGELYKYFHRQLDKENAVTIYRVLVRSYPNHPLADDALYNSGELHLAEGKKLDALSDFHGVLRWFPKSDSAPRAKIMIARLEKEIRGSKGAANKIVPKKPAQDFKTVRFFGNSKYARVVFEVDKRVQYRTSVNAEGNGITVDFLGVQNPAEGIKPIKPQGNFVKSIHVSKLNNEILRAMITLESPGTFTAVELSNPERIVLDITPGKPKAPVVVAETSDKAEAETPPEPVHEKPAVKKGPTPKISGAASLPKPNPDLPLIEPIAPPEEKTAQNAKPETEQTPEENREAQGGTEEAALVRPRSNKLRTIVLDPGHGGHDPGAIGRRGLKEKDITLDVALRVQRLLKAECRCNVLLTRSTDVFIPLEERTAYANTVEADLFVSIHVNSNPQRNAKGVETYFLSPARSKNDAFVAARENMIKQNLEEDDLNDLAFILFDMQNTEKINESSRMAGIIQRALAIRLGGGFKIKNNGVKQAMFYVLRGAKMPSVLVETSFISNPNEERLLGSAGYKELVATGISRGIVDYAKELQMVLNSSPVP
ncbi:MAG: N-acetylmuramoyl-L-alanine amidase [Nitrospinae bacterium]|nr:N-acetylmuramoyl-L-alanine amidase [Nitrospinota bacterium]